MEKAKMRTFKQSASDMILKQNQQSRMINKLKAENIEFYDLIQDLKGQLVQAQQDIRVANEYIKKLEKAHNE